MSKKTLLTLHGFNDPIYDFFKDFSNGFFNIDKVLDFTPEGAYLKPSVLDRTGFPRVNITNISLKEQPKLLFEFAVPGWNKDTHKIDCFVDNSMLIVKGEKKIESSSLSKEEQELLSEDWGKQYEHNISERNSFTWSHTVPARSEIEKVTLKDGLLSITIAIKIPVKPEPKHFYVS